MIAASCSRNREADAYRHAWATYASGALAGAAEEASRGAAELQKQPQSPWYHRFRLLQAESLASQGKAKDAEAILKTPISGNAELNQLEVRRQIDLSTLGTTKKETARELLERAKASVQDPELRVRVHNAEGILALNAGAYEKAATSFRAASQEAEKTGFLYWQAQTLNNLSVALRRQGRFEETEGVALRALAIAERIGARRVAAQANGNLGTVYSILGETKAALEYEEKSVKAQESIGDRQNLAVALGELGLLLDRAQDSDKAIPYFERAFQITRDLGRETDMARHAENLSTALIKLKRWDEAERWNRIAEELIAKSKPTESLSYLVRNQARIEFGRGNLDQAQRTAEGLLRTPAVPEDIQWAIHSLLGEVAGQKKQFARANQEFEKGMRIIEGLRSDLLSQQYRISFLSRLILFYTTYVELLVRQGDDAGALRVVEASRAKVLTERLGRNVAGGRAGQLADARRFAAQNRVVLLSFWFGEQRSFAWVIQESGIRRFDLPDAAAVEKMVAGYRETVEHSLVDPVAAGGAAPAALWSGLMAQVAGTIPRGARVIVVPDGPLHRLNLETLVVPSPKPHYWIEDVEVAVAPSIALAISRPPDREKRPDALLLIGAPDYSGTRYEPLQGAENELREIPQYFAKATATIQRGQQASPDAYRASDPGRFSVIHFAAHAEANDEKPLESAVVLSRGGGGQKLYARDVIDLPIRADLVTLSACRSAGVRAYAGEGLIGFAWAFLQAGARAVVAGLWEVSDTSSGRLMGRFYEGVGRSEDPVSALRSAKLTLLQDPKFRKPFYWAPFQVYVGSAAR